MKRLILNNEEKTTKLATKARKALLESASRDWEAARAAVDNAANLELSALNRLRTCGIKMCEAAGREQVSFQFFHLCEASLPKSMSYKAAKFCVHLSRNFDKPIVTMDEARSARQMLFEAFGHSEAPKRIGEQFAHEANPWSEFVSRSSSIVSLFKKLDVDAHKSWDAGKKQSFLRETQPIVDMHNAVKEGL